MHEQKGGNQRAPHCLRDAWQQPATPWPSPARRSWLRRPSGRQRMKKCESPPPVTPKVGSNGPPSPYRSDRATSALFVQAVLNAVPVGGRVGWKKRPFVTHTGTPAVPRNHHPAHRIGTGACLRVEEVLQPLLVRHLFVVEEGHELRAVLERGLNGPVPRKGDVPNRLHHVLERNGKVVVESTHHRARGRLCRPRPRTLRRTADGK